MKYPIYMRWQRCYQNTWTVDEVDFSTDIIDLKTKLSESERHLIQRLVAFFATGDSIVANNLVLNLYKHINSPEARMYLSRQLYEEALHVQFYLTLLIHIFQMRKKELKHLLLSITFHRLSKKVRLHLNGLTQSIH